jgi:cytochrome P450
VLGKHRRGGELSQDLTEFDPFSDTFFDDPYETYAWLRDNDPVHFNPHYGFYALSRYADVLAAHSDPDRLVSSYGVTVEMLMEKHQVDTNMMILLDPPGHTHQRRLVSQAFTRRTIDGLEPLVTGIVTKFLDQLQDRDTFDIVADFAALFPVEVISSMLGVPESERQQVRHWTDKFLFRRAGDPKTTHEGAEASLQMAGYFLDLVKERRRRPDGLIISKLIEAVLPDEHGKEHHLSDNDVAAFSVLIAGAGSETVTKLVGSGVVLFDQHPDQWKLVLADEATIPGAIEEMLRMLPPSQYQGRFAVEDVAFEGGTIPAGFPTLLLTGSATRDPRAIERPDEFDITRSGHATLAFGFGVHSCLGAWLARLESRVAFGEIRRRWPHFTVDRAGLQRVNMSNVAGYSNVPLSIR